MTWLTPPVSGPLPQARAAHSATLLDTKMVVFGGNDRSSLYQSVWILDFGAYGARGVQRGLRIGTCDAAVCRAAICRLVDVVRARDWRQRAQSSLWPHCDTKGLANVCVWRGYRLGRQHVQRLVRPGYDPTAVVPVRMQRTEGESPMTGARSDRPCCPRCVVQPCIQRDAAVIARGPLCHPCRRLHHRVWRRRPPSHLQRPVHSRHRVDELVAPSGRWRTASPAFRTQRRACGLHRHGVWRWLTAV
jgi:hypothetical protein